ncbi:MAG: DUF86 domain-containing protein [Flavobacterium sp.]
MLNENDKANLEEINYAVSHIELYVSPINSIEELLQNHLVYDAIQMNFIIIGEASKRISQELKKKYPEIDWKGIVSYRNFVVHEYFGVDVKILWSAIIYELPKLKSTVKQILKSNATKNS